MRRGGDEGICRYGTGLAEFISRGMIIAGRLSQVSTLLLLIEAYRYMSTLLTRSLCSSPSFSPFIANPVKTQAVRTADGL